MKRRTFVVGAVAAAAAGGVYLGRKQMFRPPGLRRFPSLNVPRPTPQQLAWQDMELGLFIHFGMATFTGDIDGVADPNTFAPSALDTDQWLEAAVAMGARYAVLVAKHNDGFLLWQSDAYDYGLKQSEWQDGKGDLVSDFVASCEKYGVKPGLYASTCANGYWDVEHPGVVRSRDRGKQTAYTEATETMLRELWSRYGDLCEIWFDSGVLPPEEGGPDVAALIAEHQPNAMVMQSEAATIRLSGGETGMIDYPCWSTARRCEAVGQGHPEGEFWLPVECDAPIRDHEWFWQPDEEHKLRSEADLVEMYYGSVGRNSNLLLNAIPDRRGLIPDADMSRCRTFGQTIRKRFAEPLGASAGSGDLLSLTFNGPRLVDHVVIQEDITHGERVRAYEVEGLIHADHWEPLCEGTAIGHKRIQRIKPTKLGAIRLTCTESIRTPRIRRLAGYGP